jgi:hypothetical protein
MAQIPNSVRVGGFIAPSDTGDTYPSHDAIYGKGGLRGVSTTTVRDAIPDARRSEGMMVYVESDEKVYLLKGGITNTDWVELSTQGSDGNTILNGAGAPGSALGNNGDFYIDTTDSEIYGPKTGGNTWGGGTSIIGNDGNDAEITGATATGLAAGATPTVTAGGTASSRTFAFGIPAGAAGAAATVTAGNTTTGSAGTNASVSNTGTNSAAVFNFTIPRGDTGLQGPTGPQGPTIFNSFANTSARDSVAAADRVEGFLAYLKDDDDLYIYTSSSVTDTDWEVSTGAANWKLIPKDYTVETEIDTANLINATAGEYFFNLIDTTGSVNEFKKFDINDFFGWMATQFAQSLVDSGDVTAGELNFGSGSVLGDLNGDGAIGTADLLLLLSQYGNQISNDNLVGESIIEISTTTSVSSPSQNTWVTLPISTSDISFTNNGFATNFIDADDKFGFENGTFLTLNNWSSQELSKLFLGYIGDPLASSELDSPIVLEGVFSTNDFIILRCVVEIEYSEASVSNTTLEKTVGPFSVDGNFGVAQDLEFDPVEISTDIIEAIDQDNTINKIRLKLQVMSGSGNTTSINIKSGAFFLKN